MKNPYREAANILRSLREHVDQRGAWLFLLNATNYCERIADEGEVAEFNSQFREVTA